MNKISLENEIKNRIANIIIPILKETLDTDVLDVANGEWTMPVLDAEGNEVYANIKITIPRGVRAGGSYIEYDGYAAHEEWEIEKENRAAKKRQAEANKQKLAEKKAHNKELKKTVKTMKEDIKEILPSQATT